eukprot:13478790-Ditylum_brightwellii.AAC.2
MLNNDLSAPLLPSTEQENQERLEQDRQGHPTSGTDINETFFPDARMKHHHGNNATIQTTPPYVILIQKFQLHSSWHAFFKD